MAHKSVIGGSQGADVDVVSLHIDAAHEMNTEFWDTVGSDVLGAMSLPHYGAFLSEDKLYLLDGIRNQCASCLCVHGGRMRITEGIL